MANALAGATSSNKWQTWAIKLRRTLDSWMQLGSLVIRHRPCQYKLNCLRVPKFSISFSVFLKANGEIHAETLSSPYTWVKPWGRTDHTKDRTLKYNYLDLFRTGSNGWEEFRFRNVSCTNWGTVTKAAESSASVRFLSQSSNPGCWLREGLGLSTASVQLCRHGCMLLLLNMACILMKPHNWRQITAKPVSIHIR